MEDLVQKNTPRVYDNQEVAEMAANNLTRIIEAYKIYDEWLETEAKKIC